MALDLKGYGQSIGQARHNAVYVRWRLAAGTGLPAYILADQGTEDVAGNRAEP